MSAIWHDLECGGYAADLSLWRVLAARCGGPILDVGAGTGRTAIELARAGHAVTALDNDPELLAECRRRASGLNLSTVLADARDFHLGRAFALCIVPMQTIQLLGGPEGRERLLACAREHLGPGGLMAIAIADELDLFQVSPGRPGPIPDVCERDGVMYSSHPTAVRADGEKGFVLERRRQMMAADGTISTEENSIWLERLDAEQLEHEAVAAGLRPGQRRLIAPTRDYTGSVVVMLDA